MRLLNPRPARWTALPIALVLLLLAFFPLASAAPGYCTRPTSEGDQTCVTYGKGHACASSSQSGNLGYGFVERGCFHVVPGSTWDAACVETTVGFGGPGSFLGLAGASCVWWKADENGVCVLGAGSYNLFDWYTGDVYCVLEPIPL